MCRNPDILLNFYNIDNLNISTIVLSISQAGWHTVLITAIWRQRLDELSSRLVQAKR
jgi:hypothetical protein